MDEHRNNHPTNQPNKQTNKQTNNQRVIVSLHLWKENGLKGMNSVIDDKLENQDKKGMKKVKKGLKT
jgi:hypothetical protein